MLLGMLLVALLLTKHFVCDFVLQGPYQLRFKRVYGHPGGLLHAGIHASATAVILCFFSPGWQFIGIAVLAEFAVHYHIDWVKERIVGRLRGAQGAAFWGLFGFDQLLHQLSYVAIASLAMRTVS